MTIIETAKITSKGQVTIPNRVRKLLHATKGTSVAFAICKEGIILFPCKVTIESPYTPKEWAKIEKLASAKGKSYKGVKWARKYTKNLWNLNLNLPLRNRLDLCPARIKKK